MKINNTEANIHFPFQLYIFCPLFPLLEFISQFQYNVFLCLFALTNVGQCFFLLFTQRALRFAKTLKVFAQKHTQIAYVFFSNVSASRSCPYFLYFTFQFFILSRFFHSCIQFCILVLFAELKFFKFAPAQVDLLEDLCFYTSLLFSRSFAFPSLIKNSPYFSFSTSFMTIFIPFPHFVRFPFKNVYFCVEICNSIPAFLPSCQLSFMLKMSCFIYRTNYTVYDATTKWVSRFAVRVVARSRNVS